MPATYAATWSGFDGGREGLWDPAKLIGVLGIIAKHEGEDVYDKDASIYAELEAAYSGDTWRAAAADGTFRPLFRDYAHAWTRTGLIDLSSGKFEVTPLGNRLLDGRQSPREAFMRTMQSFDDNGDRPFVILASALLESDRPLSTEELVRGVKGEYRPPADDLATALRRADNTRTLAGNELRRMKHLMHFMEAAGLVTESPNDHWMAIDTVGLGDLVGVRVVSIKRSTTVDELFKDTLASKQMLDAVLASLASSKPQVILAGPPGTGKTFIAKAIADYLTDGDRNRQRTVQFHPNYGYEDFVEGLRPDPTSPTLRFYPHPGVLRRFVDGMAGDLDDLAKPYVLVIDEMNRANLSRVLGELMYLLEYRSDGDSVELQYSGDLFRLPANLLIIGTMNTADRSIRSIDTALRRRFDIFELPPSSQALNRFYARPENTCSVVDLSAGMDKLNDQIEDLRGDRHHKIGHTFFMSGAFTPDSLASVWRHKVMPLIEEYFFDRPEDAKVFTQDAFWKP